jgi:glycine cleavage system aminomethyltransferase T
VSALGFLTVSADALAQSSMAAAAARGGAISEPVDGWEIAMHYGDAAEERRRMRETVAFVDRSSLGKWETIGVSDAPIGSAARDAAGTWLCPVTPERTLHLGASPGGATDLTSAYAALALVGPAARELLARFCALDVREQSLPVGGFRPGSIARTPGYLLRPAADELLLLVGWALGEYLYDVVADAAGPLGGGPAGATAYAEHADA